MARNRFDKLNQYLHLNNNENFVPRRQPNHDKLFKVRPFLDAVMKNLREEYRPKQNFVCRRGNNRFQGATFNETISSHETSEMWN